MEEFTKRKWAFQQLEKYGLEAHIHQCRSLPVLTIRNTEILKYWLEAHIYQCRSVPVQTITIFAESQTMEALKIRRLANIITDGGWALHRMRTILFKLSRKAKFLKTKIEKSLWNFQILSPVCFDTSGSMIPLLALHRMRTIQVSRNDFDSF